MLNEFTFKIEYENENEVGCEYECECLNSC